MSHSLSLTCISFGLIASCATSDDAVEKVAEDVATRETYEIPLSPVAMHPALDDRGGAIPGTLVFDTSEGRLDITELVPDRPREFESRMDFHKWVAETLNGKLVEREDGEPSTTLDYTASTTLRYDRALDDLVIVDDPIDAIIGGTEGYVVIAGEQVCTSRSAECSARAGLAPPPGESRRLVWPWGTGTAGQFGIRGISWHAQSSFLQWVGSNTSQWNATSGIHLGWGACWPGGPRWCLRWTGSNYLNTSYTASRDSTPYQYGYAGASNTLSVMTSKVNIGSWPFFGTNRICATHFGASGPDALSLRTGLIFPFFPNDC